MSILAVKLNPNKDVVATIKQGLKEKDGYCPCRMERLPRDSIIWVFLAIIKPVGIEVRLKIC